MDPLSLAASIIAVVQVGQAVFLTCYRLKSQISDAPQEISQIIDEISAIDAVLNELHDILIETGDESILGSKYATILRNENGPLASIRTTMEGVSKKLAPLGKGTKLMQKLKWPLDSKNVQRIIDTLQTQKATLGLVLSACQTNLLVLQADDTKTIKESAEERARAENRLKVLKWYKSCDPEKNHRMAREKHDPDTSQWIFGMKEFKKWKDSAGQSLWLHGIPGAGKTILCSTLIEHIRAASEKLPSVKVIYYYFDFADSTKQSTQSLLKSAIFQMAAECQDLISSTKDLYEKYDGIQEAHLDELVDALEQEIAHKSITYLLVDALDECPEKERKFLFKYLARLMKQPNLTLLAVSRKEPDIETALKPLFDHEICVQSAVVDADVKKYVANAMSQDPGFDRWKPALRQDILEAVANGAGGMFRWAVCQLEVIRSCLTPAMVRSELKRMPQTLDQTYDRILQSVPPNRQAFVKSAMIWLSFSARPMLLSELAEAVAIDPESDTFDLEESRLIEEGMILEICGSLVSTSTRILYREDEDWLSEKYYRERYKERFIWGGFILECTVVSLSHYTVKEYLLSDRLKMGDWSCYHASERIASQFLAQCCLLYILDLNSGDLVTDISVFKEFPLFQYAARYWVYHWRLISSEYRDQAVKLNQYMQRLFNPENLMPYFNWLGVWTPEEEIYEYARQCRHTYPHPYFTPVQSPEQCPRPLYVASALGGEDIVLQLLSDQGCNLKEPDGFLGSAIAAAAYFGHSKIVQLLLDFGADPNLRGSSYGNVLQAAAAGGSASAIGLLLDAGAEINACGGRYNTALMAAAHREHMAAVMLLLKRGADLSLDSGIQGSALHQASSAGDMKLVVALLGSGTDVNQGSLQGTPLTVAARAGHTAVVQLLLRRGADVNGKADGESEMNAEQKYPLCAAAAGGHAQIVRILLRAGADPNPKARNGATFSALLSAIWGGDLEIFRTLLDAGANMNSPYARYANCVHASLNVNARQTEMARILLGRGAQFDDLSFLTSIWCWNEDKSLMTTMLERGANVNAHDGIFGSALHHAIQAEAPEEEPVWLLLGKNPYVDAVSVTGSVLGAAAAARGNMLRVTRELLRRGANIHRAGVGGTPFELACAEGNLEIAKLLLDHGADINRDGCRALRIGSSHGSMRADVDSDDSEIIHFLVANNANLNLYGGRENCTPLQHAAQQRSAATVKLLLDLGARADAEPGKEGSSLHYAFKRWSDHLEIEKIANIILEHIEAADDRDPMNGLLAAAYTSQASALIPKLLAKGAVVDHKNSRSRTALGECYLTRDRETSKLLLAAGAKYSNVGPDVLISAIELGFGIEEIGLLLENGVDPNASTPNQTPIAAAVSCRRRDVVELLLQWGADINTAPKNGTALTVACGNGDVELTEYLLSQGADPNEKWDGSKFSQSPLERAVNSSNITLINLLLDHGAGYTASEGYIFGAVKGGIKAIDRMLQCEMTEGERQEYLNIALQSAAYEHMPELCDWLISQGADVDHAGGRYGSPLNAALRNDRINAEQANNRPIVFDKLLALGARVNVPENVGKYKSALHIALRRSTRRAARRLLEAGADPNIGGGKFSCPLQTAARFKPDMVGPLLDAGADVNAVGALGTALHVVAYEPKDLQAIGTLCDKGGDVNAVSDKYGGVIQAAARIPGHYQDDIRSPWLSIAAMELLHAHGASVTIEGGKYHTALQMASRSGNLEAVKWLIRHGADPYVKGGKYLSAYNAAVQKRRPGVISFFEQHYDVSKMPK